MALVAVEGAGDDEAIMGVARYDMLEDGRAEFALIVEDRVQRHGVGKALFWALVAAARERGILTLVANVLTENQRMLRFLAESGLPCTVAVATTTWRWTWTSRSPRLTVSRGRVSPGLADAVAGHRLAVQDQADARPVAQRDQAVLRLETVLQ